MSRQANDPDIVRKVFPPKLRTDTRLRTKLKDLLLQIQVSKRTALVVSGCGQIIQIMTTGKFDGLQRKLCGHTAHDER